MKKLVESENIISQMQDYYSFLASNTISVSNVTWTSPYLDASGLGLMVTVAMPVTSKLTNRFVISSLVHSNANKVLFQVFLFVCVSGLLVLWV